MQYATDNLVVEVLIHPQLYTLQQCMRNMLASFTKHRHIIHGGYTFAGSGSWVLNVRIFSETGRILQYISFLIILFPSSLMFYHTF